MGESVAEATLNHFGWKSLAETLLKWMRLVFENWATDKVDSEVPSEVEGIW